MQKLSVRENIPASDKRKSNFSCLRDVLRFILRNARPVYFPLLFCYLELILHCFAYRSINVHFTWVVLFSLGLGSVVTFFTTSFSRKINAVLTYTFTVFFTLIFAVELVYFKIFKGFAPVSAIKLGGQAVTNFTGGMIEGIRRSAWWLLILAIPLLFLCIFSIWLKPVFGRRSRAGRYSNLIISALVLTGTVFIMSTFYSGTPSLYKFFSSSSTPTDTSVNYFGLNATAVQEFRWMLFPDNTVPEPENLSDTKHPDNTQTDPKVDFEALYDKAGDDAILKSITAELSNMPTTQKNEYTGICKGYNLITICAEAFSPELISPELTPTLYKLSANGFVFNNFYSSFTNTTTNGEYAFCMGLFPDLSRDKTDSSFTLSASNYLPYCLGNVFGDMGKKAYAYHNYVAEFYYRNYTHVNMGYDFTAANSGLDIDITWPSSDYDMMVASVDDYIDSGEQFCAYYMTFSGHYQYTKENAMSAKNWDKVASLPYSTAVKAYIACNLELEYALTYLNERLEAAGIADKTVIVLTTDHFPYGLSDKEYAELAGRSMNDIFDKQKNSFICYVPGLDAPVTVDKYCSTTDILPTILNLFGITYDSRLLAGHDILAPDSLSVAILADGSFITDGMRFNSSLMRYQFDEPTDEIKKTAEELYRLVEKRFRLSTDILNNDYYSFVYDKKSEMQAIDNLTNKFIDVGIMEQSPVYYVIKNDIMDPVSVNSFGVSRKCSISEVIGSVYRIAGRPEIDTDNVDLPYHSGGAISDSMAWAYVMNILTDEGLIPLDLSYDITLGQLAVLITRTAELFGSDTAVNEDTLLEWKAELPSVSEAVLSAAVFCHDSNIITENADEDYIFRNLDTVATRSEVASALYRLCSYYIMPSE